MRHIQVEYRTAQDWQDIANSLAIDPLPASWQLVSSSGTARVAYHSEEHLYYKEFFPRGPLENIKALVVGNRATRARKNDAALIDAGFSAPHNVAWNTLPNGHQYIFSRAAAGQGVTHWCRVQLKDRSPEMLMQRRLLMRSLGSFIGRMHASGFTHGDLRTSNILAERADNSFSFSLIDNERTRHQSPASGKRILRNLMQLNMLLPCDITRTDRWRFFLAWEQQMSQLSPVESRLLARESLSWAIQRLKAKGLM